MVKCLSCGNWTRKNWFIFLSIIFLLINKFFIGYVFDEDPKLEIKILDNGIFKEHYLIHQIFQYLFCIILAFILFVIKKFGQGKKVLTLNEDKTNQELTNDIKNKGSMSSFERDLTLIYTEENKNDSSKCQKLFIISTLFLYIILEQTKIIFKKFFAHMDFWMVELYIVAFLNYKIFKLSIYKHQILAFVINFFSIILNCITVGLTIYEGDEKKALYVRYNWSVVIALIIYCLYAYFLSVTFINIKKFMDLKFISFNVILLVYGITGFIFCIFFCFLVGNFDCKNEIAQYIFKVNDKTNNKTYIDNFNVYYNSLTDSKADIKLEVIMILASSISYALYKLFTFKVIEDLTILHKIFSYPVYYFGQKLVFLVCLCLKVFEIEDSIIIHKFITDFISDFLSIIGYLIYIEIIEINICNCNYNLRKYIALRGKSDSSVFGTNFNIIEEDEVSDDSNENHTSNASISDMY